MGGNRGGGREREKREREERISAYFVQIFAVENGGKVLLNAQSW